MDDPIARAREIAARLSGGLAVSLGTDLGKRKNRWDNGDPMSGIGLGAVVKKKVYIPKDNPDVNYLGLLIGPRGSTQKQMQEMSGAKIIIRGRGSQKDGQAPTGHPDDEDDLHVSIEGPEECVDRAMKEVQMILFNPEQAMRLKQEQLKSLASNSSSESIYGPGGGNANDYQIEILVPNGMVGLIIGKGGENIQKMQFQTGAHMQIAKENEMKPGETRRSILLRGTPSAVAELKSKVEEIVDNRGNAGGSGGASKSGGMGKESDHAFLIKIPVPNDKVGIIIGKGGMTVKAIQDRTSTMVYIPATPDEDNPQVRTISVGASTKEAAEAAHVEIFNTLQQQQQSMQGLGGNQSVPLCIPDDKVGIIIGKGGATIKDLQNRHRVRIQIPPSADYGSNPPVRTCSITGGTPESFNAVRYEIEMILMGQGHSLGGGTGYGNNGGGMGGGAGGGGASYYGQYGQQFMGMDAGASQYYAAMQQGYYGAAADPNAMYAAAAAGAATQGQAQGQDATAVPTDPTAYYNDFWLYAAYYGEPAARLYYTDWSPPVGTQPPAGTPAPLSLATATPAAGATAASGAGTGPETVAAESAASSSSSSSTAITAQDSSAAAYYAQAQGSTSSASTESNTNAQAGTEQSQAWELYKKQYSEWYEAHGKAAGASPNPPEM